MLYFPETQGLCYCPPPGTCVPAGLPYPNKSLNQARWRFQNPQGSEEAAAVTRMWGAVLSRLLSCLPHSSQDTGEVGGVIPSQPAAGSVAISRQWWVVKSFYGHVLWGRCDGFSK